MGPLLGELGERGPVAVVSRGPVSGDDPRSGGHHRRIGASPAGGRCGVGDRRLMSLLLAAEPLNHGSKHLDVSNAERRDAPAVATREKVLSDLVVGTECEKRSGESRFPLVSGSYLGASLAL